MADSKKQLAALKELAEKMGFDLTKKVAPKKMRGGGATKAPKRMRGGGATAPKRMRGGGAAKAVSPRKRMAMGMESGGVAGIKPPKNLKPPKNTSALKKLQKVKK